MNPCSSARPAWRYPKIPVLTRHAVAVAEHQPASEQAYQQYLHQSLFKLAPIGFGICLLCGYTDARVFLVVYAVAAYYFSSKMARLVVLLGPVASALVRSTAPALPAFLPV